MTNNIITNKLTSLLILFSILSLSAGLRLHVAREATLECRKDQHTSLRYAKIPKLNVFSGTDQAMKTLRNVAIDPDAGNYLSLNAEECKTLGLKKFAGITEHSTKLYDASIKFTDASNKAVAVEGRIKVECGSSEVRPRIGLNGLLQIMQLEVEGNEVYSDLGKLAPDRVKIARSL